jgi:uncharacterized protein YbjT (DUF2867 family)
MYDTYMMTEPVLVTGATGNVGSRVVELLREAGVPVRAAGRARPTSQIDGVEAVRFDFTEPESWTGAFHGVRTAFIVRPPHLGRPRTQMVPALEAAKDAGVEHMVLLSLQGADKSKVVPHAALEAWMRESGLSWTFVRPSFFMQNLTTTHLTDIRDRDRLVLPAGHGRTSFVDAVDVAAVATAEHAARSWTPTGPEALAYDDVARTLSAEVGRPITYDACGIPTWVRHARGRLEMPWGMVAVTTAIYSVARAGSAAGLTSDVRAVTGREPTSFADFARREHPLWERRGVVPD